MAGHSALMANWARELATWCPLLRVGVFSGSAGARAAMARGPGGGLGAFNVVVTSYAIAERRDARGALGALRWDTLVFDEAHVLKNSASARSAGAGALRAAHRVLRTECDARAGCAAR
jgi:SNF2 family DNA or RNA helicase